VATDPTQRKAAVDLPPALLFDLDDTILDVAGSATTCWLAVAGVWAPRLGIAPDALHDAILAARDWYWRDPVRKQRGRHDLAAASREVVAEALGRLGIRSADGGLLAGGIADAFRDQRAGFLTPFVGAVETLVELRRRGVRLGLITNGATAGQRAKLERFALDRFFAHVLIEGEFGAGKPDERVYQALLAALVVSCQEIWSVGDDLERDVAAPQRLGIRGIWVDSTGVGLPADCTLQPDGIIASLPGLLKA
jgi:putative hydrolase of the HAD superfamily